MNILLVHPTPPSGFWPQGVFLPPAIPTELAQAAAFLRRHGHNVLLEQRDARLVRENFNWPRADQGFRALIEDFAPELLVFFRADPGRR